VADFACLKSRLIIELDGSQHVERATYDDQRTQFLEAQNFRVLRFWNGAVSNEREAVIETIVWAVLHPDWRQQRDPLPSPPPSEEGI
jgi:adenine-specific DNA-methyltransferase